MPVLQQNKQFLCSGVISETWNQNCLGLVGTPAAAPKNKEQEEWQREEQQAHNNIQIHSLSWTATAEDW